MNIFVVKTKEDKDTFEEEYRALYKMLSDLLEEPELKKSEPKEEEEEEEEKSDSTLTPDDMHHWFNIKDGENGKELELTSQCTIDGLVYEKKRIVPLDEAINLYKYLSEYIIG